MIKWLKNYWYHYKLRTILCVFFAAIIAFSVWQIATSEHYDYKVYLYLSQGVTSEVEHSIELAVEDYGKDIDGDGEVNVQVINFSYDVLDTKSEQAMSYTAALAGEMRSCENFIFLVDDYQFEALTSSNTYSNLFGKYDLFKENGGKTYSIQNTKFEQKIKDAFNSKGLSPQKVPKMNLAMRTKPQKNLDLFERDYSLVQAIIKGK